MSLFNYIESRNASQDYGFYSLLMAAMREADSTNLLILRKAYPEVWKELIERYNAPGGVLPDEVLPEDDDTFEDTLNGIPDDDSTEDDYPL